MLKYNWHRSWFNNIDLWQADESRCVPAIIEACVDFLKLCTGDESLMWFAERAYAVGLGDAVPVSDGAFYRRIDRDVSVPVLNTTSDVCRWEGLSQQAASRPPIALWAPRYTAEPLRARTSLLGFVTAAPSDYFDSATYDRGGNLTIAQTVKSRYSSNRLPRLKINFAGKRWPKSSKR